MSKPKKMGRPKEANPKSRPITFRVDDEIYQKLEDYAEEAEMKVSEVVRLAVENLFRFKNKKK